MSSKKKEIIYLSISLTIIHPCDFDVYMIYFFLDYYLNLFQTAEKQTKMDQTELSIQYIKINLQQLKEIAVFIIQIKVVPANCDN